MPGQRPGPGMRGRAALGAGTAQRTAPRLSACPGAWREGICEGEVALAGLTALLHPRGVSSPPPTMSRTPPAQERTPRAQPSLPPPQEKIPILLPSLELQWMSLVLGYQSCPAEREGLPLSPGHLQGAGRSQPSSLPAPACSPASSICWALSVRI